MIEFKSARIRGMLLCAAAVLPFFPAAVQFAIRGIPDVLFTGDGAALELGVRHAAHGAQLVGPYSRFGWNHPGPTFFYLALPFYELFDQRGPALNLFAFCANVATAIAVVFSARRLRGDVFALLVAALLAVYELVAVPVVIANEWNPIFPILPLVLMCFLAVQLSLGEYGVLPAFAFLGSVVVQTHLGYAPSVITLCAVALVNQGVPRPGPPGQARSVGRRISIATSAILALCWGLPIYEAVTQHPGNLQEVFAFFATRPDSQHLWTDSAASVVDQLAMLPWALAETVFHRALAPPSTAVAVAIVGIECLVMLGLLLRAHTRRDDVVRTVVVMTLIQTVVAVIAVHSIRGDILSYLVTWITVFGLLALVALAAWSATAAAARFGGGPAHTAAVACTAIVVALAVSAPVRRVPVIRAADVGAESLARSVETYLRSARVDHPTVQIVTRDQWPTAIAIVLFLHKHDVPVYVESSWIGVVGRPFIEPPGEHPILLVGDRLFGDRSRARRDLEFVGTAEDVWVFLQH